MTCTCLLTSLQVWQEPLGGQRTWVMLSPLKSMYGSRDGHKASGSGEAKPVGLVTGGLVVSVLFIRQQEL